MLTGCTEIPKVEIEVEIPRIQIEIPKLNVGGGKLDIHIKPPTPESPPIEKPTIKPTAFGADANNDLPSLVAAETADHRRSAPKSTADSTADP